MIWLQGFIRLFLWLAVMVCVFTSIYVWRSFPKLQGELSANGLQRPVQIKRDASDVTHIFAQNDADAAFALGYTHAQERSWQLEVNRRLMRGQLAEIFGEPALETDKLMRTLGIAQQAQRQLEQLPVSMKAILRAYADGINSFHASSAQALPPEFHVLRIKPGQWQASDSVGWALMMALDLGGNWGLEMARLNTAQKLPTQQLWQLFPPYVGEKPASTVDFSALYAKWGIYLPQTEQKNTTKTIAACAYSVCEKPLFDIENWLKNAQNLAFEPIGGIKTAFSDISRDAGTLEGQGSNNWVVASKHTESGKPLLANDPHLALGAPAIWYFARLKSEATGLDVIGATLPGMPMVVLGRNAKVAWGFTNTGPDVQDLYLERINPANPSQYQTPANIESGKGGWENFQTQTEIIKVKGQADVSYTHRRTRHGPVLSDAQALHGQVLDLKKYVIALRWSALDTDNKTLLAGWSAQKAASVSELLAAYADHHSPMQSVVAADVAGNVAFKAIGKVPLRKKENDFRGIAPAPGWEAAYDWAGYLSYEQTPQSDIKQGWLVTANQRIHASDYPHFMGQDWASPERFERANALVAEQIATRKKHNFQSMQTVQNDVVSLNAQKLLPALGSIISGNSDHPLANKAFAELAQLEKSGGNMLADRAGPLILAAWVDELVRNLVTPKIGEDKFKAVYGKRQFRGLIEQIYVAKNADAQSFWCAPKTCEQQAVLAFNQALTRLAAQYGEPSTWQWGKAHEARSVHRPFGNVPLLSKYFDVKTPVGGDPWTVNVAQYWLNEKSPYQTRHAASLRHVFDLSNLEQSGFIYQTGQSGLVWSERYRNMSGEWATGKLRKLQMSPSGWELELKLLPQ